MEGKTIYYVSVICNDTKEVKDAEFTVFEQALGYLNHMLASNRYKVISFTYSRSNFD